MPLRFLLLCLLLPFLGFSQTPNANFTIGVSQGCSPLLVQFTNTSTGTVAGTTYQWNFGTGGSSSVLQNPSTTFNAPGQYTITLTVTNPGGASSTKTLTNAVTVYPSPTPSWTVSDTVGCAPHAVLFINTSALNAAGGGTYLWNFGDGSTGTAQNPTHTYTASGSYTVALQVTNSFGCSRTIARPSQITATAKPTPNFLASSTTLCRPGQTINFSGGATGGQAPYAFSWDFGDGSTAAVQNPAHTYAGTGPYTVRLTVTDANRCSDSLSRPAYLTPQTVQAAFSTATPTGCVGVPLSFQSSSLPSTGTLQWNFGSGASPQTATNGSPAVVFAAAGTYPVRLIVSGGGCSDTLTQNVTILSGPPASFTTSTPAPCAIPATVTFTNTTTGATGYTWYFGDGSGSSTAVNPTHTYTGYGSYTDTLIAVNAAGCSTRLIKPADVVIRNIIPQMRTSSPGGCAPITISFRDSLTTSNPNGSTSLYPFAVTSWLWDFRDGTTSTQQFPTHTFTTTGTFWVKVTMVTANGCTVTDSVEIKTGTRPVASFTVNPTTACVKKEITFTSTSTGATAYEWFFGDNETGTGPIGIHPYTAPGSYTVTLVAINNGCNDTVKVQNAVVISPPNAKFVAQYSCDTPDKVRFANNSIGAQTFSWTFGDGATSTLQNPVHTYAANGTYPVRLITTNTTSGCSDTLLSSAKIYPSVLSFAANDTLICKGDSIHITGTLTGLDATSWRWLFQDGSTLWQIDTSGRYFMDHRYNTPGRYGVQLITEDEHGCFDTLLRNGYIAVAKPVVNFTATPAFGCIPLPVSFADISTNTAGVANTMRSWQFTPVNGTVSASATTTFTYTNRGSYDVTLRVTDAAGCTDSITKTAAVRALKPTASVTAFNTSVCRGSSVTLYGSGSTGTAPLSYNWDFGDGTTSTQVSPAHTYNTKGTFTVRLIVTDSAGCKDTMVKNAFINVGGPTASFTASDTQSVCAPLVVSFTNTSVQATSVVWTFGNNTGSSLANPSTTYTTPGIYTVTMVATDAAGCTDTARKTIRVLGYAGSLSYTPLSGCSPLAVQFTTNITNVPSLIWDFSDGVTQAGNGAPVTHVYQTPGAYVPKIILSNGSTCSAGSTGIDTIKVDGVWAGFSNSPACVGQDIRFTDTSKGLFSQVTRRDWVFPGNVRSSLANPVFRPTGTGSFTVKLVVTTNAGCTDSITKTIVVAGLPTVSAGPDTVVCLNDAVQLSATGAATYSWSPAATLTNANTARPYARPATQTQYVVTGTDANGCTGTDTVVVRVKTKTTSVVGKDTSLCFGKSVMLYATGADSYQWTPAAGLDQPASATPLASPAATTTYLVIAREGSCLPDSHQVKVTVYPRPDIDAGPDAIIVAGGVHTLMAAGIADTYLWTPAESLSCSTCGTTQASPLQKTVYTLIGTSRYGCSDTDFVTIDVRCDGSQVFIPNTFTPNGDGQNDYFYPHATGLAEIGMFRVYNRWGEVVFQKENFAPNDKLSGWDGSFKGEKLPPDAFVYTLEAHCQNGDPIVLKGDVTLIR